MTKNLETKIINKLCDVLRLKKNQLNDDLSMETIENWDSLKHLEIITTIDEILDNKLSKIKNAQQLTSLKKILKLIKKIK